MGVEVRGVSSTVHYHPPPPPPPQVGTILSNLYQLGLQLGKLSQVSTHTKLLVGLSPHCPCHWCVTTLPLSLVCHHTALVTGVSPHCPCHWCVTTLPLSLVCHLQTDLKRYLDELKNTAQDLLPRQGQFTLPPLDPSHFISP